VAISTDGRRVVTNRFNNGLMLWDAATGRGTASIPGKRERSFALVLAEPAPGEASVMSIGEPATAILWKLGETDARRFALHTGKHRQVYAASGDGNWLAQGTGDGTTLWNLSGTPPQLVEKTLSTKKVWSLALSGNGARIATGHWDGTVRVLETASEKEVFRDKLLGTITHLALSGDGRWVAAGSGHGGCTLLNREDGRQIELLPGAAPRSASVQFSPDGRFLVAGFYDGTARVWSVPEGRPLLVLDTGDVVVRCAAYCPTASLLATAGDKNDVKLWTCDFAEAKTRQ
jgi:WD40 repeat protein